MIDRDTVDGWKDECMYVWLACWMDMDGWVDEYGCKDLGRWMLMVAWIWVDG